MGTRFRKSINFGPLRVNISKSGVGYSVGNKYARITHTADGKKRTTLNVPGTGLSYVEESRKPGNLSGIDWQRQARENGWTPPEPEDEKDPAGIGGFQKFALLILAVIVLSTWWNNRKTDQPEKTVTTKAAASQTAETTASVLPGSVREAVMNGELELADIQHRADALGWSTDAWQGWYYIASKTGTKMEAIEEAAKELNQRLEEESPEFVESLKTLGISLEEAKAMKPEELFEKVIYGIQAMDD